MSASTTRDRLRLLARAARAQAGNSFDFREAMAAAGLQDDGSLHDLALAWARALPRDVSTLHQYVVENQATGCDVAELLERAADLAVTPAPGAGPTA